jgi:hypothetical protein
VFLLRSGTGTRSERSRIVAPTPLSRDVPDTSGRLALGCVLLFLSGWFVGRVYARASTFPAGAYVTGVNGLMLGAVFTFIVGVALVITAYERRGRR